MGKCRLLLLPLLCLLAITLIEASALCTAASSASDREDWFPFTIPWDDAANTVTSGADLGDAASFLAEKNVGSMTAWQHRLRVAEFDAPTQTSYSLPDPPGPVWTSDTNELTWDASVPDQGLITVDAEAVQAAIGFTAGRTIALTNLTLEFSPDAADFNVVTLQTLNALPISHSPKLLLGVFTRVENMGMVWNAEEISVDDRWGGPPTLIEPTVFTATLTLDSVTGLTVQRLDPTGAPVVTLPYQVLDGHSARFVVDTAAQPGLLFSITLTPRRRRYLPLLLSAR